MQGKMQDLAERKVAAVKALAEVETQTQDLPLRFQHTLQSVVKERLQAEGMLASLDVALATKAIALANQATKADELETLSPGTEEPCPCTAGCRLTDHGQCPAAGAGGHICAVSA